MFNSDCAEPLVCAGSACRAQCLTDRDCTNGWRCSASGQIDKRVCVPPGSPVMCAVNSDCPSNAMCGMDGTCHTECASDTDCPMGATCSNGSCTQSITVTPSDASVPDGGQCGPRTLCGGLCVDTQSDSMNCGACGVLCNPGESCRGGGCCPSGTAYCNGMCGDILSDHNNCGACASPCNVNETCTAGHCITTNDTCASAIVLDLSQGAARAIGTGGNAAHDVEGCTADADVFYSFTLTQREIVYVDLEQGGNGGLVGVVTACGAAATDCANTFCATGNSYFIDVLDPGTYYLVVSTSHQFEIDVQHRPVAGMAAGMIASGTTMVSGTTAGAQTQATCGTSLPAAWYYWATCPSFAGGTFSASSCTGTMGPTLELWNGSGTHGVCTLGNDAGSACALSGTIGAGYGLHMLMVSSPAVSEGAYTLTLDTP